MPLRKNRPLIIALAAVAATPVVVPTSAGAASWRDLFTKRSQPAAAPVTAPAPAATSPAPAEPVAAEAPVVAAATPAPAPAAGKCAEQPTTKAFAKFGDNADYSLAPGGDFESGAAGWTLTGGAKVVSGNENLGVKSGSRSLVLPVGAVAVSPEFCVDESHPHFRFAAKPSNSMAGYAAMVTYRDAAGRLKDVQFTSSGDMSWGAGKWAPSKVSPLATEIPLTETGGIATARISFVSTGNLVAVGIGFWGKFTGGSVGTTSVDSLMIDPYRRG